MQIPLSAYSVGTVALNLQGVNPQVIRNAVQPLALRKSKHIGLLFFAVTQRGKSYSILILNLVCRYPPGSWEGGTADTRENGTLASGLQNLPSVSPHQSVWRESFQKLPRRAVRIWWGPARSVKSPSLIAGSEWSGETAPFSSPGNSHAFEFSGRNYRSKSLWPLLTLWFQWHFAWGHLHVLLSSRAERTFISS